MHYNRIVYHGLLLATTQIHRGVPLIAQVGIVSIPKVEEILVESTGVEDSLIPLFIKSENPTILSLRVPPGDPSVP